MRDSQHDTANTGHQNGYHAPTDFLERDGDEMLFFIACAAHPQLAADLFTPDDQRAADHLFHHPISKPIRHTFSNASIGGIPTRDRFLPRLEKFIPDNSNADLIREIAAQIFDTAKKHKPKEKPLDALKRLQPRYETENADTTTRATKTPGKKSQADIILEIALAESTAFRNDADEFFSTFETNGRRLTYKIGSQAFTSHLKRRYYQQQRCTPSSNGAMQTVVDILRGMALDAPAREAFARVASFQGAIYYDLGDETGRVIEITPIGWEVLDKPPVPFIRPKGMLKQVMPRRGESLDTAAPFFNVKPEDWPLVQAFLLSFFQPAGPRPHWAQIGEQGTGKTSNTTAARSILDPNAAPTRKDPKDARDLMVGAKNNALVAFDNLSNLPQWLSDCLCCLSTGAGYATRALYENDEEAIFSLRRPVIFNGINEVATRPDLLDRTLLIELPLLPESARKPESEIEKTFSDALPLILGALFDAVAVGLKNLPLTRPQNLPRMADFALWVEACAPALGWEPEKFLKRYSENRTDTQNTATDLSTLATVMISWFGKRNEPFTGTPAELFICISHHATDEQRKAQDWPRDAQAMGRELSRLAPSIRLQGVDAVKHKTNGKRGWKIENMDRVGSAILPTLIYP